MKLFKLFKKGQKGVTLVELMVVMAILAVLASIVFPAVSGTAETSADSQVKSDAGVVETAINDYYADKTGAAVITTETTQVLGGTTNQTINSRYPENYLTAGYASEFPTSASNVTNVSITLASGNTTSEVEFANGWNAIKLSELESGKYIPAVPKSDSAKSGNFHNYLWMVKKTTAASEGAGVTVESRKVEIFKLQKVVQTDSTYELFYVQIY